MIDWWQVLAVAFSGGVMGGFVVYWLSDKGRPKIVVWTEKEKRDHTDPTG